MKKKTTKNGKLKNRVKGWNGISTFKFRLRAGPVSNESREPTNSLEPVNEFISNTRNKIADDPYARRAVTEIVKGIKGTKAYRKP